MPYSYNRVVEKDCIDIFTVRSIAAKVMPDRNLDAIDPEELILWYKEVYLVQLVQLILKRYMIESKK